MNAEDDDSADSEMGGAAAASSKSSSKGCSRHSYTVDSKLRAIEFAKANSNEAAAKQFSIATKQIREWRKKEDEFKLQQSHGRVTPNSSNGFTM